MKEREWTVPRIIDVIAAALLALPLTVFSWLQTILQVGFPGDHIVNCVPPNKPQPGDAWVCQGDRFRLFQWFGIGSLVLCLLIVWGGMALSLRRGWWLVGWPLLGIAFFGGVVTLGVRALEWH
ncbi:hypothetical protein [Flexivirga endophytica]|uniref:hypothetical protein n=1 Tax=Flexivirga endophytica TaxID=1849103 RepID=UPI0016634FC7|nr:hypothetical protein [Flexivirga endophytica]